MHVGMHSTKAFASGWVPQPVQFERLTHVVGPLVSRIIEQSGGYHPPAAAILPTQKLGIIQLTIDQQSPSDSYAQRRGRKRRLLLLLLIKIAPIAAMIAVSFLS